MAKFYFRLQSLLSIKEKIEEQKKMAYGQAVRELERLKRKKILLEREREVTIQDFQRMVQTKINPSESWMYNDYIALLKKRIAEQEKMIKKAEVIAEQKRLELVEAMKERKMLETLREHTYEEYLSEEKLAEQKQVDQVVSYRYNNRE